jgi:hypothetical protein
MVTAPRPFDIERHAQAEAWGLVVRVAVVVSLLAAATALALTTFVGLSAAPVVAALGLVGLLVGLRLPAARPPRLTLSTD